VVYDITGKEQLTAPIMLGTNATVSVKSLRPGNYFVTLQTTGETTLAVGKLVIVR